MQKGGDNMSKGNKGSSKNTPNDNRSNSLNSNNPASRAAADNRSNQMNSNTPAYRSSRSDGKRWCCTTVLGLARPGTNSDLLGRGDITLTSCPIWSLISQMIPWTQVRLVTYAFTTTYTQIPVKAHYCDKRGSYYIGRIDKINTYLSDLGF